MKNIDVEVMAMCEEKGNHIHYDFFVRGPEQSTWANCGHLTVRTEESASFESHMPRVDFRWRHESKAPEVKE
jgi:hypothetical protein